MDYFNEANKLYNLKEYDKAIECYDKKGKVFYVFKEKNISYSVNPCDDIDAGITCVYLRSRL